MEEQKRTKYKINYSTTVQYTTVLYSTTVDPTARSPSPARTLWSGTFGRGALRASRQVRGAHHGFEKSRAITTSTRTSTARVRISRYPYGTVPVLYELRLPATRTVLWATLLGLLRCSYSTVRVPYYRKTLNPKQALIVRSYYVWYRTMYEYTNDARHVGTPLMLGNAPPICPNQQAISRDGVPTAPIYNADSAALATIYTWARYMSASVL